MINRNNWEILKVGWSNAWVQDTALKVTINHRWHKSEQKVIARIEKWPKIFGILYSGCWSIMRLAYAIICSIVHKFFTIKSYYELASNLDKISYLKRDYLSYTNGPFQIVKINLFFFLCFCHINHSSGISNIIIL